MKLGLGLLAGSHLRRGWPAVLLLTAAVASAEDHSIAVLGGATFAAATAPAGAAAVTVHVSPNVAVVFEISYMRDILPKSVDGRVDDAAGAFENFARIALGQRVTVRSQARACAAHGGVGIRLFMPGSDAFRVFFEGDVGFVRVDPVFKFFDDGTDISTAVAPPLGVTETKPALGFGGGFTLRLGGPLRGVSQYRYTRNFTEQVFSPLKDGGFETHRLLFGIEYRF